jgi:leucyl-tRNA synthetase
MKKASLLKYEPGRIEAKWQKIWTKNKTFQVDLEKAKNPYYNLMMFPYPSAEGLHIGNMYAFTGSDIWGRYMGMKGYDVFEPIGLDGFGIHSENYALKVGRHPKKQAKISEKNFYRQLHLIGGQFSWDNTLETYDPEYYRWTQWIFIQLFKAGLAYRKKSPVNWCPSCKTVLADEQVIKKSKIKNQKSKIDTNICERCESEVTTKNLEQWFFRITRYADRLLENTKKIDWSEKVLISQRNWIGKKQGINITYPVISPNPGVVHKRTTPGLSQITCFTTRPDTNFGATFVVLAPEHPQLAQITSKKNKKAVSNYVQRALRKSKEERMAEGTSKTGVFTGSYAVNQLTNKKMPIWVSDFVLMEFGTGAVVGVPGHDKRDFQFAKKFGLDIIRVVLGADGDQSPIRKESQVQEKEGKMINSRFLNGKDIHQAIEKMMIYLEKKGWGKKTVTYHLRDWLISRQRYWGPPIPMIKCQKCGWQPVPEKDLPVLLPEVEDWRPKGTGKGPLASVKEWVKTKCPQCAGPAERETDVSDTFLDSAWYFLRYPSVGVQNSKLKVKNCNAKYKSSKKKLEIRNLKLEIPWNQEITERWLPVDMYIGGAEHAVLHLLYSRFLTMVFKDLGLLDFSRKAGPADEPFIKFRAHGLIIKGGAKMSKSKGNVITPDKYIKKYGADVLRCYLMFLGPLSAGGDFRDTGMKGMYRFLARVYRLCQEKLKIKNEKLKIKERELYWQNLTIKRVSQSIEKLKYNTAISALMEYLNFLQNSKKVSQKSLSILILLLAPFAPHLTEELWKKIQSNKVIQRDDNRHPELVSESSVHHQSWPQWEEKYLTAATVEIVVQINGKVRDRLPVEASQSKEQKYISSLALKSAKIQSYLKKFHPELAERPIKTIFVPGKLINFVV